MKRQRHTPEEIIKKLREAATLLAGGQSVHAVCKKLEVRPPTYHRCPAGERPHPSLDYQTPVEFAQRSLAAASATLRQPPGCALPADHITTNPTTKNHQKLSWRVDQQPGAGQ